ncbi:MAG: hypothetical protein M1504_02395 [Candidatus Marsarchaeota archaeon]|nr:hypothetical protein [Candidatus Marsarchaeota archaeon]
MQIIQGIVTSIRRAQNQQFNIYTILSNDRILQARCGILLELYDLVEIDEMSVSEDGIRQIDATKIRTAGKDEKGHSASLRKFIKQIPKTKLKAMESEELEKVTKSMEKELKSAALSVLESFLSGSPVLVRFHNDCDGSSGAIALYNAVLKLEELFGIDINITWRMNRSIAYTTSDLYSDTSYFNTFESAEKPIVLIIDFGTTKESEDAVKKCEYNFVWLDHHPIYEEFNRIVDGKGSYINTWNFGGNSDYTAGYLACVFAEMLHPIDTNTLRNASLIGDFSSYADRNEKESSKMAVVLDYLTSKKLGEITPKRIAATIYDNDALNEAYSHASTVLNEYLDMGVKNVEHHKNANGTDIYVLDFWSIKNREDEYPLPGRYTSKLQERMESLNNGRDTITIVHSGDMVSMRISRNIVESTDILNVIKNLKEHRSMVDGGGGHGAAASVRATHGNANSVIKLVLAELGVLIH